MLSAWKLIQHIQSQHGLQLCSSWLEAGGSDRSHSLKDDPLAMAAATAAATRQLLHCSSNGLAGPHNLHHQLFPNGLIPVFEPGSPPPPPPPFFPVHYSRFPFLPCMHPFVRPNSSHDLQTERLMVFFFKYL